jgi:hypothetical protein
MFVATLADSRRATGDSCEGNTFISTFLYECFAFAPAYPCICNLFLPVFFFSPTLRFLSSKLAKRYLMAVFRSLSNSSRSIIIIAVSHTFLDAYYRTFK